MKNIKKIYNFTAIFEPTEEGGYVVYVPPFRLHDARGDI